MKLISFFIILFLFNLIVFSLSINKLAFGQINNDVEQPLSDFILDNYEFLIFIFFLLIIGAIIWKITHQTKERRYFSAEVKRQILKDQNYKCAILK